MSARPGPAIARVRVVRVAICVGVAVVAIVAAALLRATARSACDVTSPLLNGIDLVEYAVVGLVVVTAVSALLEAKGVGWWVVPAAGVVALAAAWVLLVVTQPAAGRPSTVGSCTENLPDWWPGALPG
jgi:hypothetical protein